MLQLSEACSSWDDFSAAKCLPPGIAPWKPSKSTLLGGATFFVLILHLIKGIIIARESNRCPASKQRKEEMLSRNLQTISCLSINRAFTVAALLVMFISVATPSFSAIPTLPDPPRPLSQMSSDEQSVYFAEARKIRSNDPYVKPIIDSVTVYKGWAIVGWIIDPAGGESIYKKDRTRWVYVTTDGGAFDAPALEKLGAPHDVAEGLVAKKIAQFEKQEQERQRRQKKNKVKTTHSLRKPHALSSGNSRKGNATLIEFDVQGQLPKHLQLRCGQEIRFVRFPRYDLIGEEIHVTARATDGKRQTLLKQSQPLPLPRNGKFVLADFVAVRTGKGIITISNKLLLPNTKPTFKTIRILVR